MARTLLRGLTLVESLAVSPVAMGLTELARFTDLDKGTTARLIATLVSAGYVQKDAHGKYVLTNKLRRLGQATAEFDLRQQSRPHLLHLRDEVNETIHLGVVDADEVLYLDQLQPTHPLILVVVIGRRSPMHSTALGKAMLAKMDERDRERVVRRLKLSRRTASTITSRTALRADLRLSANRGYAIDADENVDGGTCVAAAISGPDGAVLGAINISFPSSRNGHRLDQLGARALATADAISRAAGGLMADQARSDHPSANCWAAVTANG